jgi:purine-binding chemotaxis protein CheW
MKSAAIRPSTRQLQCLDGAERRRRIMEVLLFELSHSTYGLWLSCVSEVARAVHPLPLPGGPDVVLGVIQIRGEVVPVFDVRSRFGKPSREAILSDHLIVAKIRKRLVALAVDKVSGITDVTADQLDDGRHLPRNLERVAGLAALESGLVLIHDLGAFLSEAEEAQLDAAVGAAPE